MKENVSTHIEVKASGGIRDLETAKKMLAAGATRLGTSAGVSIAQGAVATDFY
jgi:deoxyribose-phosphate aldolase